MTNDEMRHYPFFRHSSFVIQNFFPVLAPMRALVLDQSLTYRPRQPEPAAEGGDTLIRVRQAGICATDLELVKGYMEFHGVLGHEFVGEVVQSPDKELVGRRVVGEINIVCGRCDLCLS